MVTYPYIKNNCSSCLHGLGKLVIANLSMEKSGSLQLHAQDPSYGTWCLSWWFGEVGGHITPCLLRQTLQNPHQTSYESYENAYYACSVQEQRHSSQFVAQWPRREDTSCITQYSNRVSHIIITVRSTVLTLRMCNDLDILGEHCSTPFPSFFVSRVMVWTAYSLRGNKANT